MVFNKWKRFVVFKFFLEVSFEALEIFFITVDFWIQIDERVIGKSRSEGIGKPRFKCFLDIFHCEHKDASEFTIKVIKGLNLGESSLGNVVYSVRLLETVQITRKTIIIHMEQEVLSLAGISDNQTSGNHEGDLLG